MRALSLARSLLLVIPVIVAATGILGVVALLWSLVGDPLEIQRRLGGLWARIILLVSRVRVDVRGLEHLPAAGPLVLVGNHLSNMDVPALLPWLPFPVRFLAKSSLFRVPILGHCLKRARHFEVDFDDARASLRSMREAARTIDSERARVLIFPEGGRSAGDLDPFKEGAAYVAIAAQAPVTPLAIWGTREVIPPGSLDVRPGRVAIEFGPPLPTAGLSLRDRAELTEAMRNAVTGLLARCRARLDKP